MDAIKPHLGMRRKKQITSVIKQCGKFKPVQWGSINRNKIFELDDKGWSAKEISERLKVSKSTVLRALKQKPSTIQSDDSSN